ncbi:metallophosphoesterase [Alicyclobacillaceae bacterium I2511]|nr:metallophosphoesterase [Alicyclobacillaceae bacterium I2511]
MGAVILGILYGLFILPTQWLKIERISYSLGLHQTVLQISDLHVEKLRVSPALLKKVLQQEAIDYVFLTGDFCDQARSVSRLQPYLTVLQESSIPVFAVLGNHDYRVRPLGVLLDQLAANGIFVLRNTCVRLPGFQLVGIDDLRTRHADVKLSYTQVDRTMITLVLTHDPNLVLSMNEEFDYLLAGHLHGRQFNVPGLFLLKPMGPLPRSGIYAGLHRHGRGAYYISKGLGQAGINARLFVRSEVTLHYL